MEQPNESTNNEITEKSEFQTVPCPVCQNEVQVNTNSCPNCKTELNW